MTKVLLEDSWEATDVIEYCTEHNIECTEVSQSEIYEMNSNKFLEYVFMCGTGAVKYHLDKLGLSNIIPDTYETAYSELYGRTINKIKFEEIPQMTSSVFIKPTSNDKNFCGQIFDPTSDINDNDDLPDKHDVVYYSQIITFMSEYRILVGNGKVYGIGFMQGYDDVYPDENIINQIVELTKDNYRCVDVGLDKKTMKWLVVEINPPYSLDQYTISLDNYMNFVVDSCIYIQKYYSKTLLKINEI